MRCFCTRSWDVDIRWKNFRLEFESLFAIATTLRILKRSRNIFYLALVNMGSTLCHSWSVMWGMPDKASPHSWWPYLDKNLCRASSVRLSELSRSRAIRFRALPSSAQAFNTLSLKPFSWPALRKRRPGILDNMSIRHSVDRSVAVTSSSWMLDFSHSTCITYSLWRSGKHIFRTVSSNFAWSMIKLCCEWMLSYLCLAWEDTSIFCSSETGSSWLSQWLWHRNSRPGIRAECNWRRTRRCANRPQSWSHINWSPVSWESLISVCARLSLRRFPPPLLPPSRTFL